MEIAGHAILLSPCNDMIATIWIYTSQFQTNKDILVIKSRVLSNVSNVFINITVINFSYKRALKRDYTQSTSYWAYYSWFCLILVNENIGNMIYHPSRSNA